MKKKIAVIGAGISGLGSSLILSQEHDVHLFEADDRLGGHAHTSQINLNGINLNVDTGFLVYNELTYPHLIGLFKYLEVNTVKSDMSLSISVPHINLEWAGDNLDSVFAQRKNLLNPKFYKLLLQILKFHKEAETNREISRKNKWTIGELLNHKKYSKELTEWYILPMVAAIWSTPEIKMLDFPAETFLTFFLNHKLLQVNDRPQWLTVYNGSINYVNKIASQLQNIHLAEPVISVEKNINGLKLVSSKQEYLFDNIVFAIQPSIARKLLKEANEKVLAVLNSFESVPNVAYLHQDIRFMPKSKKCWASWCVTSNINTENLNQVSLTYYLNRLQPLATTENLFLTLNPSFQPNKLIKKFNYSHPQFNQKAIDAQITVPIVQGIDGMFFAGAWTRYGFHEDGLLSAVKIGEYFKLTPPWVGQT